MKYIQANSQMEQNMAPTIWSGQLLHFSALTALLLLTGFVWIKIGSPLPILFWFTIGVPIAHQIFVWLTWRLELKSKLATISIGFKSYLTIFFLLFIGRAVSLLFLAWMNQETLGLSLTLRVILGVLLLSPALYTIYSVEKYFSFKRAAGADHFDSKYRSKSLVKKGIFKYSTNGMYVFGFFLFWGIAIIFNSEAALLAGAFSHPYIWIHYFATERPDMKYIYR